MPVKTYNIVTKTEYDQNGETKKRWNRVGRLVKFPESERGEGGYKMEMFMYPDTAFYVFEDKPRDEYAQRPASGGEVIQTEDVPL